MKLSALFAVVLAGLLFVSGGAWASGRTFFVDYQSGSDTNSGLSQSAPFKHAPSDLAAQGNAKAVKLAAGDTVVFRAGVRYRGQINISKTNATAVNPIRFTGVGYGSGRAIFDGSTQLKTSPCSSSSDCSGATNWKNLVKATVPAGAEWIHQIYDSVTNTPLAVAQFPAVPSVYDTDSVANFMTIPRSEWSFLQSGKIRQNLSSTLFKGTPSLALWGQPNEVEYIPTFSVSNAGLSFTVPAGYKAYRDRDNKFSILNSVEHVNKPGTYAIDKSRNLAIIYPSASASSGMAGGLSFAPSLMQTSSANGSLSIGSGRYAFKLVQSSHIIIENFDMVNFSSRDGVDSGYAVATVTGTNNITIRNNSFRSFASGGNATLNVVSIGTAPYVAVLNNRFAHFPRARVLAIGGTAATGPVDVGCNSFDTIGRTGIAAFNAANLSVRNNMMSNFPGQHGNAISIYLDNRNMSVVNNFIINSDRPMTMHGDRGKPVLSLPGQQSILISGNTFLGNSLSSPALTSYGGGLANVTITGNMLSSSYMAMRLNDLDKNMVVKNNVFLGNVYTLAARLARADKSNTILSFSGAQPDSVRAKAKTPDMSVCSSAKF